MLAEPIKVGENAILSSPAIETNEKTCMGLYFSLTVSYF